MPTIQIPEYRQKVQAEQAPGVRDRRRGDPRDYVGNLPQRLDQASDIASKAYAEQEKNQKEARLNKAYVDLNKARFDIQDTIDGEVGEAAVKGDLEAQGQKLFRNSFDKILEDIGDEEVKRAAEAAFARENEGLRQHTVKHVGAQALKLEDDSWKAASATAIQKAARGIEISPDGNAMVDPAPWQDLKALEDQRIRSKKIDPAGPIAQQLRVEMATAYHASVFEATRGMSPSAAQRYLALHEKEMDPEEARKLHAKVKTESLVEQATAKVMALEAEHAKDPAALSKELLDAPGELGVKMRQIAQDRDGDRKRLWNETNGRRLGTLVGAIEKGTIRSMVALETAPGFAELEAEDPERAARVRAHMNADIQQRRSRGTASRRETMDANAGALADFEFLWQTDPESAANVDVGERYAGAGIDNQGLKALRVRQTRAKNEWERDRGVSEGKYRTTVLTMAGAAVAKGDQAAFLQRMADRRQEWLDVKGNETKTPTARDVASWIVEEVRWGENPSPGPSINRQRFKLKPGQPWEAFPDPKQPAEVQALAADLEKSEAPAPAPSATVIVDYKGKRLQLPRARLAEAIADGAKEVR